MIKLDFSRLKSNLISQLELAEEKEKLIEELAPGKTKQMNVEPYSKKNITSKLQLLVKTFFKTESKDYVQIAKHAIDLFLEAQNDFKKSLNFFDPNNLGQLSQSEQLTIKAIDALQLSIKHTLSTLEKPNLSINTTNETQESAIMQSNALIESQDYLIDIINRLKVIKLISTTLHLVQKMQALRLLDYCIEYLTYLVESKHIEKNLYENSLIIARKFQDNVQSLQTIEELKNGSESGSSSSPESVGAQMAVSEEECGSRYKHAPGSRLENAEATEEAKVNEVHTEHEQHGGHEVHEVHTEHEQHAGHEVHEVHSEHNTSHEGKLYDDHNTNTNQARGTSNAELEHIKNELAQVVRFEHTTNNQVHAQEVPHAEVTHTPNRHIKNL